MSQSNCIKTRTFKGHKDFRATLLHLPPLREDHRIYNMDKKIHEWLEHGDNVKPYYDVDANFATKAEWESAQKSIGDKWAMILMANFPEGTFAVSTCHRKKNPAELSKSKKGVPWFVSFHFVVNNYSVLQKDMAALNAMLGFYDPNATGEKSILVEGYDKSVYSDGQNFRMIYQSKPMSTAQQMPYNMLDAPQKHTIQYDLSADLNGTIRVGSQQFPLVAVTAPKAKKVPTPISKPRSTPEVAAGENVLDTINNIYDKKKLKSTLFRITSRYDYEDWLKVLFAVYNITSGDNFGLTLIHEWSALDAGYDKSFIDNEYKWLNKKANEKTNKIGFATLVKWAEIDNPTNIFKSIYLSTCELDDKGKPTEDSCPNVEGLVDELNKELIFVKETGEYIILDSKLDGTPCWFLKGVQKVQDHYKKYSFNDPWAKGKANPFKIWSENLRRREVIRIGFNPENIDDPDIFNLWKGFAISHEDCEGANIGDCAPMLDHIKTIWCKGSCELFEYVVNYFARIIQIPHKKSGVMLCLKSKQGAGKGVVFEALAKIIGNAHYAQVSNANNVFGEFNGTLEAKILIDLDEAFWGGDKKLEGMIKNKITEKSQIVNKKNKEAYTIDDYANYAITTNNDRFASASSPEDRRHYCIELDNRYAGLMKEETTKYFAPIIAVQNDEAKLKAFAKFLYEKDLSEFNPRIFNKTPLLQDQIQQSWNSVQKWWFAVLQDEGFDCEHNGFTQGFCKWNSSYEYYEGTNPFPLTGMTRTKYKRDASGRQIKSEILETQCLYFKDFLYSCYAKVAGSGYGKFDKSSFFRALKQDCLDDLLNEVRPKSDGDSKRVSFISLPSIKKAQEMFNKIQSFPYKYGEDEESGWGSDDYDESDYDIILYD